MQVESAMKNRPEVDTTHQWVVLHLVNSTL